MEKTGCGFHDAVLKMLVLFFGVLKFDVFNISSAKSTPKRIDVKVNIFVPLVVSRAKKVRSDRASFGATESLKLPDVRQEIFEICG